MSQYRGKRVPDYNVDGTDATEQDQERWMRERDREILEAKDYDGCGHGEEKRRRGGINKVPTHQSTPPEIESSKRDDSESGQKVSTSGVSLVTGPNWSSILITPIGGGLWVLAGCAVGYFLVWAGVRFGRHG